MKPLIIIVVILAIIVGAFYAGDRAVRSWRTSVAVRARLLRENE